MLLQPFVSGWSVHTRPAPQPQSPYTVDTTGNPVTSLPGGTRLPQALTGPLWLESAWSMRIDGLPWLPGLTSSKHPERCLTWFLGHPLWKDWVDKILTASCVRGMNTFTLSWPDCRDSCGMTVQSFTALCAYIKSWGMRVHVKWWSKDGSDPQNSDWPTMQAWVTPVLSSLLTAKAVDEVSPWEWNANNIAGPQGEAILDGVTQLVVPYGVRSWYHGGPGNVWWGAPTSNRDEFWQKRVAAGMTGLQYQSQPILQPGQPPSSDRWDVGTLQARILDSTNHPGFVATGAQFLAWEIDGAEEFDADWPDETAAAGHGYLALCTPGQTRVTGTGNGLWLPSGQNATV
jgi:hypothetical protein